MVDHMEREFGERALNGDKSQAVILQAKIDELERKLETQRLAENSTADSKPKSEVGSENETDSDVSTYQQQQKQILLACLLAIQQYSVKDVTQS